jgi:hypothetical protein
MVTSRQSVRLPKEVSAPGQLKIRSLGDLEHKLGKSRETRRDTALHRSSFYNPFTLIKPARPFAHDVKQSKPRIIDRPIGDLLEIQQRIYYRILRPLAVPEYICGGVQGRSVMMNVRYHEGTTLIVTMDIRAWFPSITERHVYNVWRRILGCSHKVAKLMTALTTYEGHLPQGAPTSTAIANLVLYSIDRPIRLAAASLGVNYSSWVDDLPFSGAHARTLIRIVIATFKRAGFKISRSKLKVMGPGKQRIINGVVLGQVPSISRKQRWRIRAALHRLRTGDIAEWELEKYIKSLHGRIAHLESVNEHQARSFRAEFEKIVATLPL